MPWRRFLFYNAAGGITWAVIYGLLGYFAGRFFHDNFAQVEAIARTLSWGGALFLVALIATLYIAFRLFRKRALLQEQTEDTDTRQNHDEEAQEAASTVTGNEQDEMAAARQENIPQSDQ